MKIRYITPFALDKNIGREYNQVISELPDDCYIVLRDGDTMFLTPDWGKQIKEIILANPEYDLITCMTNRIGLKDCLPWGEFMECDISGHIRFAGIVRHDYNTEVKPTKIAPGMLMIFHKSVWEKTKFIENSYTFDKEFSRSVRMKGGKIGVAKGLYLFHLYRWGQEKPQRFIEHLK